MIRFERHDGQNHFYYSHSLLLLPLLLLLLTTGIAGNRAILREFPSPPFSFAPFLLGSSDPTAIQSIFSVQTKALVVSTPTGLARYRAIITQWLSLPAPATSCVGIATDPITVLPTFVVVGEIGIIDTLACGGR